MASSCDRLDFDNLTCRLCEQRFASPGDLAAHEQDEEEGIFRVPDPRAVR